MSTWFPWLCWGIAFLGLELPAAFNARQGDTLSEQVWRYLTRPHAGVKANAGAWAGRVVVGGLLVWLFGHFEFGIWSL